jgi:hypothetical protein
MWKISAEGGEPVQIGKKGGGEGIVEAPDGNFLYYSRDGAVFRSTLSGENEIRVIDVEDYQAWRLCGNKICVLRRSFSGPSSHLIRYAPSTRRSQTRLLDAGPRLDASTGLDISPDGRWVVYSRADSVESDIMMVENFR